MDIGQDGCSVAGSEPRPGLKQSQRVLGGGGACWVLTSDQGLVYHLKQGLSKHVLSSGGFLDKPHSGPLRI